MSRITSTILVGNSMERINFTDASYNDLVYKLRKETGIEYEYYRRKFLEKRIKSRMIRLNLEDPMDYLVFISKNPSEIEKFLSGFTINVTNFFRNLEVFERIQRVICNALGAGGNGRKMQYYANEKNTNGFYKAESILKGKVDEALLALLQEKTQANPFFAQQVLYYFQENDLLERDQAGVWKLKTRDVDFDIPGNINAILIARIDRLAQRVKEVVQTAAVLGREFDVQLLSRMLQAEALPEALYLPAHMC